MTGLTRYAVGAPWPHQLAGEGLQMLVTPDADWLSVTLVATARGLTRPEVRALTKGRIRVGIVPSPPLVHILLMADGIDLDAPYCIGLHQPASIDTIRRGAGHARSWAPTRRGALLLAVVDTHDRATRGLRMVSLSRDWWVALADGLDACGPVTPAGRDAAMGAAYCRWPDVTAMTAAATVVEVAGKI
ncbi:hypothetical protein P7L78_21885 [Tistrella bauzanensis]|uniref:hypothetical protein n=1 Tax=Tistrella TaxID=171436 RepID=UPI0031F6BE86